MVLNFLLKVFLNSICHCLKSVSYKKGVCVCACVCMCLCLRLYVCVCVCVMQDVGKINIIWFLQNALQQIIKKPPNQIFDHTYIGNTIKIAPFQEGGLKENTSWEQMQQKWNIFIVMWIQLIMKIFMYYNIIREHLPIPKLSLLLTSNIFHTLLQCFYCQL